METAILVVGKDLSRGRKAEMLLHIIRMDSVETARGPAMGGCTLVLSDGREIETTLNIQELWFQLFPHTRPKPAPEKSEEGKPALTVVPEAEDMAPAGPEAE